MALWTVSLRWSDLKIKNDLPACTAGPLRILPADCPEAGSMPLYGFAVFFGNELIGVKGSHGYSPILERQAETVDDHRRVDERAELDMAEAKEFASGFVTHACFLHVKPYKPSGSTTSTRPRDQEGRFLSNETKQKLIERCGGKK